jgi:choline kinase
MKTEVVVLAAGRGARLGDHGAEIPKWLLEVGQGVIADCQLDAIERAAANAPGTIGEIRVVTGHATAAIDGYLARRAGSGVETLFNPEYERLNNWYSVLHALRSRSADAEAVAVINSDLYASPEWLQSFFDAALTTTRDSLIATDLSRALTEESMKVSVSEVDGNPVLQEIGKVGIDEPAGEYVGMLMARGQTLRRFERKLESFVDAPGARDAWYEQAVGESAAEGAEWWIWPTPGGDWIEIDDHDDLRAARAIAGNTG